jgi:hypothetical protein
VHIILRVAFTTFRPSPRPIVACYATRKKMPPKKAVKEEKILLGRPSNNLKIGVVGLPNVGHYSSIRDNLRVENPPFST